MERPPFQHVFGQNLRAIAQVLAISDELGVYTELDDILRRAVELTRERLKFERVSICLRDEKTSMMRGSFGTGALGETLDERWHAHRVSRADCEALRRMVSEGKLWRFLDDVELQIPRPRRTLIVGRGWNSITPMFAGGKLVGVMYADAALSGSAFDAERQLGAALLCGTLANVILAKNPASRSDLAGGSAPTRTVRRVLAALEQNAGLRGQELAREFGLSPGHLARIFKSELGVSLVEYRNRLRLRRFFASVEGGEANLVRAANSAGFGSYAQFHRVCRQTFGTTPSDLVSRGVAERLRPVELNQTTADAQRPVVTA